MKLISGPMATLSTEAFRVLVEQFGGCDEYFTEMINASTLITGGPWEKFYLINKTAPDKMVWQLTGHQADKIIQGADFLCSQNLGGIGIDLNMGCSAPQIYRTGAGISWMLKPIEETAALVKGVKEVLNQHEAKTGSHLRLSVKCRLGDEDFTVDQFIKFSQMLAENGVELITLHARTKKEKYRGLPKYEYCQKLKEHFGKDLKVYLNGAIDSKERLDFALSKSPDVDGIMVARMAAQKPWIFKELKSKIEGSFQPFQVDCQKIALDFLDLIEVNQPVEFHKTRVQRFFTYYCQNFFFGHNFQSAMLNYHSLEESRQKVNDFFNTSSYEKIRTIN